jgi:hypothetical protein
LPKRKEQQEKEYLEKLPEVTKREEGRFLLELSFDEDLRLKNEL